MHHEKLWCYHLSLHFSGCGPAFDMKPSFIDIHYLWRVNGWYLNELECLVMPLVPTICPVLSRAPEIVIL